MSTLSPKKLEIQKRNQRILDIAREMILADGYHGLNMDRIAEDLEISKGTIYNHFSCKEEIIIALLEETSEKRRQMFQKAAMFQGCSRFRIMAIGQADFKFFQDFSNHSQFERMIQIPSIWEKTSEKRRSTVQMCEASCMMIVGGIVRDGLASGDLELDEGTTAEEVVFGLWSMHHGAQAIISSSDHLEQIGIKSPVNSIVMHSTKLLDGFNWKPLSSEYDERKVIQRIHDEVLQ